MPTVPDEVLDAALAAYGNKKPVPNRERMREALEVAVEQATRAGYRLGHDAVAYGDA